MLIEKSSNVHVYNYALTSLKTPIKVLFIPDIHFDNPKCRRDLLKKDLDEALEIGARVVIPGDLFCLMQGNYDPRKSKSDIRPQHNVSNYIDAVIEEAIEWFGPYAEILDVIGDGNHETNILKRQETNVLERFVSGLNIAHKPTSPVAHGGYGGWYIINISYGGSNIPFKVKYFHGSGGGSPVTKGTIQHNRMAAQIEGADAIVMGHVPDDYEVTHSVETLTGLYRVVSKEIIMFRCSTYKDEYFNLKRGPGSGGWHTERGGGPKPLGGRWLELNLNSQKNKEGRKYVISGRTYRTKNTL